MYLPLNRHKSKLIGGALMVAGFLLSSPPFIPTPDDFLNVGLGGILDSLFGFGILTGILITYLIIGPLIFLSGAMIFPYNTKRLLVSVLKKVCRLFLRMVTPWKRGHIKYMLLGILGFVIIIFGAYIYENYLETFFRMYLQQMGLNII